MPKIGSPSKKSLQNAFHKKKPPHLIVEALAGTGKTTTIIEGLKRIKALPTSIEPSIQQLAIWESLELSKDAKSVCFVAFNTAIAKELKARVPPGCDAMTMHSMGNRSITSVFGRVEPTEWRTTDLIAYILDKDVKDLRTRDFELLKATDDLVRLCKLNLISGDSEDDLDSLSAHYDVETGDHRNQVYELVPQVLELAKDVNRDRVIDFADMIWLPIVLNLPVFKYDLLLTDEIQDLSRAQQALARRAGKRLILVGDSHQAIYGFAGADSESMNRIKLELSSTKEGCKVLPLTVTRRCGVAIVNEAKKIVPNFQAHESNSAGIVSHEVYGSKDQQDSQPTYHSKVQPGDFILCRVTAPLVSQCFKFLKDERRAEIIGRNIGQGLIRLIRSMKASTVPELIESLDHWHSLESEKEHRKRHPSEARLIALQDKRDCLIHFTEDMKTIADVTKKIESIFTDTEDSTAIRLSTIHKAKGLEAKRVFLLQPVGASIPHPMAKSTWQISQEFNLLYVAITRAIEELVYVS